MSFEQRLDKVVERYNELKEQMAEAANTPDVFVKYSKEFSELEPFVMAIANVREIQSEIASLESTLADSLVDQDFKDLAIEELESLKSKLPEKEKELKLLFLPKDAYDEKNAIIEVRAGTGGDEAALFAANLFRMYQRYAEFRRWKFEPMYIQESELGGIKEAAATIIGKGVFSRLKFESGVHRVQRVPETEASGRIHTSAATVAVLPELEDVDIKIDEKDLKIEVMRASGAGGQHVNKTESAIRITHIPTGIVVAQQDERSQHMNRAKAFKILRARLFEHEKSKRDSERSADRKNQIGSGDRSERIRTYNFPQGRVTDHRINLTLYKIDSILEGGGLDDLVDPLLQEDQERRLAESIEERV